MAPLYETLTDEGPYAYMVWPQLQPDGTVKLPRLTTLDEIVEAYDISAATRDLLEVIGLTEIRGSWYTFQDNISSGVHEGPAGSTCGRMQTLGLVPFGCGSGITGELVWIRHAGRVDCGWLDEPNTIPADPLHGSARVHAEYEAFLDALRANDVDARARGSPRRRGVDGARLRRTTPGRSPISKASTRTVRTTRRSSTGTRCGRRHVEPGHRGLVRVRRAAQHGRRRVERRTLAFHTAELWMPAKTGTFIVVRSRHRSRAAGGRLTRFVNTSG